MQVPRETHGSLAAATRGVLDFLLQLFLLLHSVLPEASAVLRTLTCDLALSSGEEEPPPEPFVSVTRARPEGSLVVGVTPGGMESADTGPPDGAPAGEAG